MKLTLLIDLDDTLLANDMAQFEPAYLKKLSKHLSNHIAPEIMLRELLNATTGMIKNDNPFQTLEATFDKAFYLAVGISKEDLSSVIASFYEEVFPSLISVTSKKPDAQYFINWAVAKGHRIIIATNPLFPRTAIYQRLTWAGFPPAQYPFKIITSYEKFHFAKPNPAYYAEILAQLGWPEGPVIMVGNDYHDDILPAKQLGFTTFWVRKPSSDLEVKMDKQFHSSGNLYDLVDWLESSYKFSQYTGVAPNPDALMAILRANLSFVQAIDHKFLGERIASDEKLARKDIVELIQRWADLDRCQILPGIFMAMADINPDLASPYSFDQSPNPILNETLSTYITGERFKAVLTSLDLLKQLSSRDWDRDLQRPVSGVTRINAFINQWVNQDCALVRELWGLVKSSSN